MKLKLLNQLFRNEQRVEKEDNSKQNSTTLNQITLIIICSMVFSLIIAVFVSISVFERNFTRDTLNSISHISNGAFRIMEDWANNLRTLSSAISTRPDVIAAISGERDGASLESIIEKMTEQSDFEIMAISTIDMMTYLTIRRGIFQEMCCIIAAGVFIYGLELRRNIGRLTF